MTFLCPRDSTIDAFFWVSWQRCYSWSKVSWIDERTSPKAMRYFHRAVMRQIESKNENILLHSFWICARLEKVSPRNTLHYIYYCSTFSLMRKTDFGKDSFSSTVYFLFSWPWINFSILAFFIHHSFPNNAQRMNKRKMAKKKNSVLSS
jgi:hypothetical protein